MNKTFSIKTLGCKLNQYESALIASHFIERGWKALPFGERAQVVIINTCTVTNKSDKKCRNYIRQGARLSSLGKAVVTGCMAERDKEALSKMPEVLEVFDNKQKDDLFPCIRKYIDDNSFCGVSSPLVQKPFFHTRGFLKIQDGCDGQCTYCIVPRVRGNPRSRDFSEVIKNASGLIENSCPEIVLTGITVGKYNNNGKDLSHVIESIINLKGNFRIRISSIEPNHINDRLLSLLKSERVCSHIHLPLQSGSDAVLEKMKRPYSVGRYMSILDRIKCSCPDIALGTDIILGFPGEREKDFMQTLNLVREAGFAYVHQFAFSERDGTEAAAIDEKISPEIIAVRSEKLRAASSSEGLEYRKRFTGKVLQSVIEKNRNSKGYTAVTSNYIKIKLDDSIDNDNYKGRLAGVRLLKTGLKVNTGIIEEKF